MDRRNFLGRLIAAPIIAIGACASRLFGNEQTPKTEVQKLISCAEKLGLKDVTRDTPSYGTILEISISDIEPKHDNKIYFRNPNRALLLRCTDKNGNSHAFSLIDILEKLSSKI